MPYWIPLGSGSYNQTYRDKTFSRVLKVQLLRGTSCDLYDAPTRSVRLWNSINPDIPAKEIEVKKSDVPKHGTSGSLRGWECPFVHGKQAQDGEIAHELINIYNRTGGRVVLDPFVKFNFITMSDGRVVCVDVGLALELDTRSESIRVPTSRTRRMSITSLNAWRKEWPVIQKAMQEQEKHFPDTISTLYALLLIKFHRADLFDVTFLKGNKSLVRLLANGFKGYEREHALLALDDAADRYSTPAPELAYGASAVYTAAYASEAAACAAAKAGVFSPPHILVHKPTDSHDGIKPKRVPTDSAHSTVKPGALTRHKPTEVVLRMPPTGGKYSFDPRTATKITMPPPGLACLHESKEDSSRTKHELARHGFFYNPLSAVPAGAALLPPMPITAYKAGRK